MFVTAVPSRALLYPDSGTVTVVPGPEMLAVPFDPAYSAMSKPYLAVTVAPPVTSIWPVPLCPTLIDESVFSREPGP